MAKRGIHFRLNILASGDNLMNHCIWDPYVHW